MTDTLARPLTGNVIDQMDDDSHPLDFYPDEETGDAPRLGRAQLDGTP